MENIFNMFLLCYVFIISNGVTTSEYVSNPPDGKTTTSYRRTVRRGKVNFAWESLIKFGGRNNLTRLLTPLFRGYSHMTAYPLI